MKVFISNLIRDISEMPGLARFINGYGHPDIGVELIAFTHDEQYWEALRAVLKELRCAVTFHGPYIGTEGTSAPGTEAHKHLLESYRRVFQLAGEHGVEHVVYHTTQIAFEREIAGKMRAQAEETLAKLFDMADEQGVRLLIENLPYPSVPDRIPLYSNDEYTAFFDTFPAAESIIDIGHANVNGLDISAFLARHGEKVKAYHFHNNDGKRDMHNDIRDGSFAFSDFEPVFRRYTPAANIVLEYEPHVLHTNEALIAQAEEILKRFG